MQRPTDWWLVGLVYDPIPQDPDELSALAGSFYFFADAIAHSRQGVVTLLGDPAIVDWLGKSGAAFQEACQPFPGMLTQADTSYAEVGDAIKAFADKVRTNQAGADGFLATARTSYEALKTDGGFTDAFARKLATDTKGVFDARLNNVIPGGPDCSFTHDQLRAALPQIEHDWSVIYGYRNSIEHWTTEHKNAKILFHQAVESAADLARDVLKKSTGIGGCGTFGQRFQLAGGDVLDLNLSPDAGRDLEVALIPHPGTDPAAVAAWWNSLTDAQRQQLITDHPELLGNLDGVPCAARDQANRLLLQKAIDHQKQLLADAQAITHVSYDGPDPTNPAYPYQPDADLRAALGDYFMNNPADALQTINDRLDALNRLQAHLNPTAGLTVTFGTKQVPSPPMLLLGFDPTAGNGHAIVAFNNPDHSSNVVTYVPGLGTTFDHWTGGDIDRAQKLAIDAGIQAPGTTTSSIAWLNYDAPLLHGDGSQLQDNFDVAQTVNANHGADTLTPFLHALRDTNATGAAQNLTALGHSYGSLVVGTAAARPGGLGVDNIILVGSPGVGVEHAAQLNIDPTHVWAATAVNDPVPQLHNYTSGVILGIPIIGSYLSWAYSDSNHGGTFGQNPATHAFGGSVFQVSDQPGIGHAHSAYWDTATGSDPTNPGEQDSLDNMSHIVTGQYSRVTTR